MISRINLKDKRLWITLIIVLFIIGSLQKSTTDKKQSTSEWGKVGIGIAGLVLGIGMFFVPGGQVTGTMIGIASAGLLFGAGSLFSGISGLFTPDSTIPSWIWIGGFLILAFMIFKKK